MTAAHDPAAQRLGILVALLGILLFALNDTLGKWLVATYTIGQVLLLRSAAALIILIPLMWVARTRLFPVERPKLQTARVAASTLEVFCFYFAVRSLPLADVMTYWLAAPIYVAALSPWLLGEHVGPWRWGAIFLGFVGVVVALQPGGGGLSPAILISIIGSFAFALMVLSARSLRATQDYALVFWQTLGALAAGIVLAPFDWVPPSGPDLALLGFLGIVAMGAHLAIARSLKLADAATIAPLHYTIIVWAIIFGWLAFGDVPTTNITIGASIIVAAGLTIWFRETHIARMRRAKAR